MSCQFPSHLPQRPHSKRRCLNASPTLHLWIKVGFLVRPAARVSSRSEGRYRKPCQLPQMFRCCYTTGAQPAISGDNPVVYKDEYGDGYGRDFVMVAHIVDYSRHGKIDGTPRWARMGSVFESPVPSPNKSRDVHTRILILMERRLVTISMWTG